MNPQTIIDTLNALLNLSESGRMDRSEDRPCRVVRLDQGTFRGECVGEDGKVVHHPRIVVEGRRAFGCTCPDHARQRGTKGPCKHVISLAKAALIQTSLLEMLQAE